MIFQSFSKLDATLLFDLGVIFFPTSIFYYGFPVFQSPTLLEVKGIENAPGRNSKVVSWV